MEGRRVTRSSRRSSTLPVSPVKQAVMATVMQGSGKTTAKRNTRKVLSDKTNATPTAGSVPKKSPRKAAVVAQMKVEEFTTPRRSPAEPLSLTPVMVRGEDLLRSVAHSKLAIVQTPEGSARQVAEAETPQFGVPTAATPCQFNAQDDAGDFEVTTPPQQDEIVDARPPVETSPDTEVPSVSERLSLAWVGRDVDEVAEAGEDDDSDCSVLVNVSSPSSNNMHLVASPAPGTTRPNTPQTADFKWQRRDQAMKVKEQESESFKYYGGDDEYEGCEEYDGAEEYEGEVIDCEDICQGISRMGVAEVGGRLPEHKGRHLRFNYNSDDEIDVEEVEVMRLRGLPTPMGKHLRFPQDQE